MIFYNLSSYHNKSTKNTTMALYHIKQISIRDYLCAEMTLERKIINFRSK